MLWLAPSVMSVPKIRCLVAVAALGIACSDPYGTEPAPKTETAPQVASVPIATAPSNGFGEEIRWEPFDDGLARAKAQGLPIMMVVHAGWCPRCKELKPSFSDSTLTALSRSFVMVNVDADAEPRSQQPPYTPDGDYIPRVMFVDAKTGEVDATLVNARRTQSRYFYTPADDLLAVMQRALSRHEST